MKRAVAAIGAAGTLFLLLAIPAAPPWPEPAPGSAAAFVWDRDAYWSSLEQRFLSARATECAAVEADAGRELAALHTSLERLATARVAPESPVLDSIEVRYFELAPLVAACPAGAAGYVRLQGRLRETYKEQSGQWDVTRPATRARLYSALYGSRAAAEEVLLHHPDSIAPLLPGRNESSAAPRALVHGVEIRSGDILVSRGGYPTSALIARGNDYPGNFSHVALVHVDSATGAASTVEAHIERGVSIATAEEYLGDKKLRIMVLRLRADLPALVADPLLPHRAATRALERARSGRIGYDFSMDYTDPSRLFCSEVASSVYRELGVTLWTGLSTISAPGLRRWLASFGVEHFETQEPSDLEYDAQLVVVAEWRDPASLFADHIDNAVVDAMLERAETGTGLEFSWYRLPVARAAWAYGWLARRVGGEGPIPEGMSAEAALRNAAFTAAQRRIAGAVREQAEALRRARGYPPPYWTLLELARAAGAGWSGGSTVALSARPNR